MSRLDAARRAQERGRRIYAVGDIHGRADLLDALIAKIRTDAEAMGERVPVVFLGDYVDRGLDSCAVLDRLLDFTADARFSPRFLKGNHEAALLNFLAQPEAGGPWLSYGGAETLYSYGVEAPAPAGGPEALRKASEALKRRLPAAHLDFLTHLEIWARHGDYVFVHAGLRPGRSLEAQKERDLLEIRDAFIDSRHKWPFTIVHGHTPVDAVYKDARRICVDTGAYMTGRLSAVCLEGGEVRVLST